MGARTPAAVGSTQIEEQIQETDRESRDRDAVLSLAIAFLQRDVQRHEREIAELKRSTLRLPGAGAPSKSPARH
jgi:hypothetical protein